MTRKIGINFHGIGQPRRDLEPGEAPYWITPEQFDAILGRIAAAPDPGVYVITFDDSNMSDVDIALPRLLDHGLQARFFVLTGRLDQKGSLGAAQLRELQAAGMKIGSHGIAHRAWAGLDNTTLRDELETSKSVLEEICQTPVTSAGIPFGSYDARVLRALRGAGYAVAYSSDGGWLNPAAFLQPRTSVRGDMTDPDLTTLLLGQSSLRRRLRRKIGMLKRRSFPM